MACRRHQKFEDCECDGAYRPFKSDGHGSIPWRSTIAVVVQTQRTPVF